MATTYFQGGDSVELLSAHGKAPASTWKLQGKIVKTFDKAIKANAFLLDGSTETKMQLPKNNGGGTSTGASAAISLGLTQRFLVLQLFIPFTRSFSIEIGFSDFQKIKRRFLFASAFRETARTALHVQVPFSAGGVSRDTWMNLVLDLAALTESYFPGSAFRSMESICISGTCRIKRIFTMKDAPRSDWQRTPAQRNRGVMPVAAYADTKDIPKQFQFTATTSESGAALPAPTEYFIAGSDSDHISETKALKHEKPESALRDTPRAGVKPSSRPTSSLRPTSGRSGSAAEAGAKSRARDLRPGSSSSAHAATTERRPTATSERSRPPTSEAKSRSPSARYGPPSSPGATTSQLPNDHFSPTRRSTARLHTPRSVERGTGPDEDDHVVAVHVSTSPHQRQATRTRDGDGVMNSSSSGKLSPRAKGYVPRPIGAVRQSQEMASAEIEVAGRPSSRGVTVDVGTAPTVATTDVDERAQRKLRREAIMKEIALTLEDADTSDDHEQRKSTQQFLSRTKLESKDITPEASPLEKSGSESDNKSDERRLFAFSAEWKKRMLESLELLPVKQSISRAEEVASSKQLSGDYTELSSAAPEVRIIQSGEAKEADTNLSGATEVRMTRSSMEMLPTELQRDVGELGDHLSCAVKMRLSRSSTIARSKELSTKDEELVGASEMQYVHSDDDDHDEALQQLLMAKRKAKQVQPASHSALNEPSSQLSKSRSIDRTINVRPDSPQAANVEANDGSSKNLSGDESDSELSIDLTEDLVDARLSRLHAVQDQVSDEDLRDSDNEDDDVSERADQVERDSSLPREGEQNRVDEQFTDEEEQNQEPDDDDASFDFDLAEDEQTELRASHTHKSVEEPHEKTHSPVKRSLKAAPAPFLQHSLASPLLRKSGNQTLSHRLRSLLESTDWSKLDSPLTDDAQRVFQAETAARSSEPERKRSADPVSAQSRAHRGSSLELIYDPVLQCYQDPVTRKYYARIDS